MKKAIDELKRLRSILSGILGLEDDDQEYIEDARKSVDHIIEALEKQPAQQITEAQVEAALKAAHMHSTPESRKDMRQAIEAAHNIKEQP